MAPTLVNSYIAKTSSPTTAAITTASFTPSAGEIIVVKAETWDRTITMSTPSITGGAGGSLSFTSQVSYAPAGFRPWVGIWTGQVSGTPASMTISSTPSANAQCSILVERWSSAQLDATPVTATANASSGAANGSLTTTAANSVISWVAGDSQSLDPATRAYLNSASDEGVRDGHVGANGVGYHAYANVAAAGATSFGLSSPTGMQYAIAGIEVKAASGATPISLSEGGSSAEVLAVIAGAALADAGSAAQTLAVTATAGLADAGAAAQTLAVSAAVPLGDSASAAQTLTVSAAVALADAGSAADALVAGIGVGSADAGAAADALAVAAAAGLGDVGHSAEALTVVVTLPLTDAGHAAEAIAAGPAAAGLPGEAHGPDHVPPGAVDHTTDALTGARTGGIVGPGAVSASNTGLAGTIG